MRIIIETNEQPITGGGGSLPTTVDLGSATDGGAPAAALIQAVGQLVPPITTPVTAREGINAGAPPAALVQLLTQLAAAGSQDQDTDSDGGSAPGANGV